MRFDFSIFDYNLSIKILNFVKARTFSNFL